VEIRGLRAKQEQAALALMRKIYKDQHKKNMAMRRGRRAKSQKQDRSEEEEEGRNDQRGYRLWSLHWTVATTSVQANVKKKQCQRWASNPGSWLREGLQTIPRRPMKPG